MSVSTEAPTGSLKTAHRARVNVTNDVSEQAHVCPEEIQDFHCLRCEAASEHLLKKEKKLLT